MPIDNLDLGLTNIKMAIAAAKTANKMLDKYGKITPKLPIAVPHLLIYGPPGTGKTTRVEEAAKLMGVSEEDNSFMRINCECIKSIADLIFTLLTKLSWQGYRCNNNTTNHENCSKKCHCIVDPVNPSSSIKPQLIFFDELHTLSKDLQEKLGLILLDFKYQLQTAEGIKTFYFPKFTFAGATTKPGDLLKPLRTRFGLKIAVNYKSDIEMEEVVRNMIALRGWVVEDGAIRIIARMAQGIPREAENHLTGLFNCWNYCIETLQGTSKRGIIIDIAKRYASLQGYTEDGLSSNQIQTLYYLRSACKDGKPRGVGVKRICNALGIDEGVYLDEIEPRLITRRLITSGGKGREITEEGVQYIQTL